MLGAMVSGREAVRWNDLAFELDAAAVPAISEQWHWLLDAPWRPILCSRVGGLFLETDSGVFWLEAGSGTLDRVADDAASFHASMEAQTHSITAEFEEWFLPGFVAELHEAGKIAAGSQCYGMTIPPVFEGGT